MFGMLCQHGCVHDAVGGGPSTLCSLYPSRSSVGSTALLAICIFSVATEVERMQESVSVEGN